MVVIFLAAVLPAAVLLGWFSAREGYVPDPVLRRWAFGAGVLSTFAVLGVGSLTVTSGDDDLLKRALDRAFLGAAIPEELAKLLVLVLFVRDRPFMRRPYDLVVAGAAVGAGFASIENFFYLNGSGDWQALALVRGMVSVPGHVFVGAVMGYCLAQKEMGGVKAWVAAAFTLPMLMHGLFDFPLMASYYAALEGQSGDMENMGLMTAIVVVMIEGAAAAVGAFTVLRQERHLDDRPFDEISLERNLTMGASWVAIGLVVAIGGVMIVGAQISEGRLPVPCIVLPFIYGALSAKRGYDLLTAPI